MAGSTGIDRAALERAATELEGLITDATVTNFENLKGFILEAGRDGFDAAQWLEHVVIDRRHGMIEHVRNLKFVFDGLAKTLRHISETNGKQDTAAANGMAITALNGWISQSKAHAIPPAAPAGSGRKANYNSGDTANPEGAFALYDIDAADRNPNGPVKITVPLPGDSRLPPGAHTWVDEYG